MAQAIRHHWHHGCVAISVGFVMLETWAPLAIKWVAP